MTWFLDELAALSPFLVWIGAAAAAAMSAAVLLERTALAVYRALKGRLSHQFHPVIERALGGDQTARAELLSTPARHRAALLRMLIDPLIDDRDPQRIERAREIALTMAGSEFIDRYLRSRFWWRRALALRALGLVQATSYTYRLIAALDDANPDVRAAALDGLADMRDAAALPAIVARVNDTSLHRGRRGAAIKALGADCEPMLLDVAEVDPANRLNYLQALAICGTSRTRGALCRWARDSSVDVRAMAFLAMAFVGLDDQAARVAIEALESDEPRIRAAAAHALNGWQGPGGAAARLAPHLDDTWAVAANAARALRSMGPAGEAELRGRVSHQNTGGLLARQMLWELDSPR